MKKEIIGIVGTIASGKDKAGDYISEKLNIPSFQISSPLKQICEQNGIEPTRDNLIKLGTKLASERGDGYLAEYILGQIETAGVITGMRQLGQIALLKSKANLTIVSIDADPSIRFERARENGKIGEAQSIEEFVAREAAENSPPNVQRLFQVIQLADFHIDNNASIEELYAKIDALGLSISDFNSWNTSTIPSQA